MQEGDGPGTDSSWTPWKTLHHQTKDLSPWMTEGLAIENMRQSPVEASAISSVALEEEEKVKPWRRYWRIYAILAAVIWFVFSIEHCQRVSKLERYKVLTCFAIEVSSFYSLRRQSF